VAARIHDAVKIQFGAWTASVAGRFEKSYERYLNRLPAIGSRLQYDLATMELLASLRSGHTWFRDSMTTADAGGPIPFRAEYVGGQWIVTTSDLPLLKVGDVLQSIDNVAITKWFQQRRALISASSNRDAKSQLFHYYIIFPLRFSLRLQNRRIVTVDRIKAPIARHPAPITQGRWLEPGVIGYIQIPSFGEMRFIDAAVSFIHDFRTAATIIIDLRGNSGGPPEVTASSLLSAVLAEPRRHWREVKIGYDGTEKDSDEMAMDDTKQAVQAPPVATLFAGRVLVLTDRNCASLCEDVVMALQTSARAAVIGETTAGTFAPTVTIDFGDGRSANIARALERFPDGTQFEGRGIAPDVAVSVRAGDIRSGRDPVLDAARAIAASH
jgi:carboxyl-terminal processing protease